MCGILGYTHLWRRLPAHVLAESLDCLTHRGPDHQGSFTSDSVSLGATRLRIHDLLEGDQPLHSPDRNIVVVFNGEIFNHRQLRAELEAAGFAFQTHCDTEVVLNAFLHWGTDCFARFRGMFAIAVWNNAERRLILARDRMGIKPLYYYNHYRDIFFGSELKCILVHPEVPRKIDLNGLNCFLSLNYVPGPFTLVEGVTKLMPGHLLDWQLGRTVIRPFVPKAKLAPVPKTLEEACGELDQLMTDSVREQLDSDVPVGVWLSGGLDSSSVLHYASQLHSKKLHTFSVTFQGRSFDESSYIHEVSQHYGTEHSEFDLNPGVELASVIEEMSYYSDEPGADAGALPLWFLAKMTKQKVTVALSGEGSDELFGGYLTYKANRYRQIAQRVPSPMRRAALAVAKRAPVSDEKISFEYKLKRFLNGSLLSPEAAHVFWNGTFSSEEKKQVFRYSSHAALDSILENMPGGKGLQRYLDFDQHYYLPDDILYKVDRISMAHAVEVRPPFLDDRIVDFASRLPEHFKLTTKESKIVLRRLMRNKLPEIVLRRPKVGFDIPIHDWFRSILKPLLLDTLSEDAVRRSGLFHWPAIERLLQEHFSRKANWGYHLWGLMTLFLWMKKWNIETPGWQPSKYVHPFLVYEQDGLLSSQPASSF